MRVRGGQTMELKSDTKIDDELVSPIGNYCGNVAVGRIDGKPYMLLEDRFLEDYGTLDGVKISEALYAEFVKQFKGTPDGVP